MEVFIKTLNKYVPCEVVRRNKMSIWVRIVHAEGGTRVIKKRYSAILEEK